VRTGRIDRQVAVRLAVEQAQRCCLLFDFDGVLAPIQPDPDRVQATPGVAGLLGALARRVTRVEVVSGRPVAFLRSRLDGAGPIVLNGLYGLEVLDADGRLTTDDDAEDWVPVVRELVARARRELPAGVRVEDKRLSVGLHYREAPATGHAVERWARAAAERHGLRAQPGRMVVELRPPVERGKGSVVREAVVGCACAWYAGDDLADLEAFEALAERERLDSTFVGVRIAVHNAEVGERLAESADVLLASSEEVRALLEELNARFL
jgi:trehalose 6-phosphate phosphatase